MLTKSGSRLPRRAPLCGEGELSLGLVEMVGRPDSREGREGEAHDLQARAGTVLNLVAKLAGKPEPELLVVEVLGAPGGGFEVDGLPVKRRELADARIVGAEAVRQRQRIAQGLIGRLAGMQGERTAALGLVGHDRYSSHGGYSNPGCAFLPLVPESKRAPREERPSLCWSPG